MYERRALAVAGAVLVMAAACGETERPEVPVEPLEPVEAPPPEPAPVDTAASAQAILGDTGLIATVRRGAGRRYSLSGETRAARVLEVGLEDGHRMLFGPTEVEVQEGHFHLEFTAEPSDQDLATLYLTTPDGARQWVIAIPADSAQVRFGPTAPF